MADYTSRVTLYLERELSTDELGLFEDCLTDAVFKFIREYNIPLTCLSFVD